MMYLSLFNGNYDKWFNFYNIFQVLVDTNAKLSDIQKFYYLRYGCEHSMHTLDVPAKNYKITCLNDDSI